MDNSMFTKAEGNQENSIYFVPYIDSAIYCAIEICVMQ